MRRWALRIFVFLLLGAIVSVAVAWGFAWWRHPLEGMFSRSRTAHQQFAADPFGQFSGRHYRIEALKCLGGVSIRCTDLGLINIDDYERDTRVRIQAGKLVAEQSLPSWSTAAVLARTGMPAPVRSREDALGWPMLSMRCFFEPNRAPSRAPNDTLRDGLRVPDYVFPGGATFARALPLRPIWPGFAINTLFYAAILWVMFATPFAIRRWRRVKGGLCQNCGYDLRGSGGTTGAALCPECGNPVSASG
jgi:hypothetical protein